QTSMLCARPRRWSSLYERSKSEVIQVDGRSADGAAHARMTPRKSASTVNRQPARRALRPVLRCARQLSRSKIARGSGDHHEITGSDDQGKIPARYAVISVSGSSDPPVATRPESSCESTTSSLHAYGPMASRPDQNAPG